MEARVRCLLLLVSILPTLGASARTKNFVVTAATPALASQLAQAAETMRRDLAIEWLGRPLADWEAPCPVVAKIAPNLGAGGRTSFMFRGRTPFGWDMEVQGSHERVLDSVLPHEITHTIFATHFGCPLPRWADEGACTTVEHESERRKQEMWLVRFLKTERGIPFNHMFAMTEYPGDILPLYSQGYSLARFLIAQGGKPKFIEFVGHGLQTNDWTAAVHHHYGFNSLGDLQVRWLEWVIQGSREPVPSEALPSGVQLASAATPRTGPPAAPARSRPLIDDQLADARMARPLTADTNRTASTSGSQNWYARRATETDSQR